MDIYCYHIRCASTSRCATKFYARAHHSARRKAALAFSYGYRCHRSVAFLCRNGTAFGFSFHATILKEQLKRAATHHWYDNRFGKQSGETFEDYVRFGAELGIEVLLSTPFDTPQGRASSSTIRKMLHNGEVDVVQQLLSRPYSFLGKVVHGYQEGRKLGFPTANIEPKYSTTILPKEGVYAVQIELSGSYKRYNGMLNIGNRPTYGTFKQTIEVHIFDFNEEII